jgi:hypothetical protein
MPTSDRTAIAHRFSFRLSVTSIDSNRFTLHALFLLAWVASLTPLAFAQIATFNVASVLNVGSPGGNPLNIPANVAVDDA